MNAQDSTGSRPLKIHSSADCMVVREKLKAYVDEVFKLDSFFDFLQRSNSNCIYAIKLELEDSGIKVTLGKEVFEVSKPSDFNVERIKKISNSEMRLAMMQLLLKVKNWGTTLLVRADNTAREMPKDITVYRLFLGVDSMSHSFKNKPNKKTYDAKLTELNDGVGHSTFNNIPEAAKECFNVSFWDKVKRPVNSINRFFDRFNDWSTPLRVAFWTVAAAGMAAAVVFTGGAAGVPALAAAGAYATTVITTGTLATTGVSVGAIAAPTILAATPTIYRRVKDFTLTVWNGAKNALSSLLGAADRADSVIVPLSVRQNTVVQTSVPVVVTSSDVLSQQQTTPPLTQESTSPLLISVPKESAVIMAENPKQEERVAQATNLSSDVLSQQQTTPPLTQESASPALVFPTKNDSDAAKMIVNEAQDKLVTDPAASKVAAKLLSKSPLMEILAPPSEIPEPSMEVAAAFHAHTVSLFGGKVFGAGRHFTSANDDTAAYVP